MMSKPQSSQQQDQKQPSFTSDTGSDTKPSVKKKRDRDDDEEIEEISADNFAKMSRSERKRHREKKRRSDVNKGFDELMTLLLEIDPQVRLEAEERARRGQWKGTFGAHEENLLSRVDLISRTVEVLRRIHRENEERKQIIATLTQSKPGLGLDRRLGDSTGALVGASLPGNLLEANRQENISRVLNVDMGTGLVGASLPSNILGSSRNNDLSRALSVDGTLLRAATEPSQLYSGSLLDRLSNARLLAQQLNLPGPLYQANDYLLAGAASQVQGLSQLGANASLLAAISSPPGNAPNLGATSAVTRQYLQLLQSQQELAELNKGDQEFNSADKSQRR